MAKKMTMADIANLSGVGKSTVSRYFNGGYVKDETRAKIQKVIEEYNYTPNAFARLNAKHESETLEKVVAARNQAMTATNIDDKIKQENVLSGALKSLFAVSESYPELKANENFNKLQDQLQRLEEEIAASRRYYNGVVNRYNTKTELFPGNIIAGIFGFKRKPLFEVSNESERENVQVKF